MAKKNSDTGASTNLNNFNSIITSVKGLGVEYDPSNLDLAVGNLQKLADEALAAQKAYIVADAKYRPAVEIKQDVFSTAGKLFPSIVGSLKTGKASDGTLERVKALIDKYRGTVKTAKKEDDEAASGEGTPLPSTLKEEPKKERSNRQTSYPFLIQHFEGIFQILVNEPKYAPKKNEAIKLTALENTLQQMRSSMTTSDETELVFSRSRELQTKLHNDPERGIFALAALTKAALIEDFGVSSTQYKSISSLSFKKLYDSTAKKKKKKKTEEEEKAS